MFWFIAMDVWYAAQMSQSQSQVAATIDEYQFVEQ